MANERLRAALARDRWTVSGFADALSVDHFRLPEPQHRAPLDRALQFDPAFR